MAAKARRKTSTSRAPISQAPAPSTLGSAPLVPVTDSAIYGRLFSRLNQATMGAASSGWDDVQEFAIRAMSSGNDDLKKLLSFTMGNPQAAQVNWNDRFAKRHPIADLNIPRTAEAVFSLSYRYAQENPFVAKALRTKTMFTCKDFQHRTTHTTSKEFYDYWVTKLHLKSILPRIVWSIYTTGVCPVYWGGEDGGPLTYIDVVDPRMCQIQEIVGTYRLWLKITPDMFDAVKDPQGNINPKNKAMFDSLPKYWIKQIKDAQEKGKGFGLIELKPGSYAVIDCRMTMGTAINNFNGIPLQPIFDALQRYRLLAAGDFAVAWNLKNLIVMVTEGDPKSPDLKNYFPADDLRVQKIMSALSQPDYSMWVYADPSTKVTYVYPPADLFTTSKYDQPLKEIKEGLNLPAFLWTDANESTFGSAVAQLKLLREEVGFIRLVLEEQFFLPLYERIREGVGRPGFAKGKIILPSFDINSLQDDTIWLTATKELYGVGAISLRSLCDTYGLDFDYEMDELKQEHKDLNSNLQDRPNKTTAQPLFESSQGNSTQDDNGGRPETNNPDNKPATPGARTPRTAGK